MAADNNGRAKTQALVATYAKHAGMHNAIHQTFDTDNDRSIRDFEFHYFPKNNTLQACVYIVASMRKQYPDVAANEEKVGLALNDLKLEGLYGRDGGYFFFNDTEQITFLAKDYSLASTTPGQFIHDVDSLDDIAGLWVTNWLGYLADQTFGHEPMPTRFATRENNPYPRQ